MKTFKGYLREKLGVGAGPDDSHGIDSDTGCRVVVFPMQKRVED